MTKIALFSHLLIEILINTYTLQAIGKMIKSPYLINTSFNVIMTSNKPNLIRNETGKKG